MIKKVHPKGWTFIFLDVYISGNDITNDIGNKHFVIRWIMIIKLNQRQAKGLKVVYGLYK